MDRKTHRDLGMEELAFLVGMTVTALLEDQSESFSNCHL